MRMLVAAAFAALTLVPTAHAATPAQGEVSAAQPKASWTGEAYGQPLKLGSGFQTHANCIAPFCDSFSLTVKDPGALRVYLNAPGSAAYTDVRVTYPDGTSEFSGQVRTTRGTQRLDADRLRYRRDTDTAHASGDVSLTDEAGIQFRSPEIELKLDTREGYAARGDFTLPDAQGRGDAERVIFEGHDLTRLDRPRYTTCPPGRDDWYLHASELTLDSADGLGVARHARVSLFGVPLFYVPYFRFPISDERQSGFLVPALGYGSNVGTVVATPYYFNIAPNYDDTFTPRYLADRGLQLQNEFRYLGRNFKGQLETEYLANDKLTGDDRGAGSLRHEHRFSPGWSGLIDVRRVSDDDYLGEFGNHLGITSKTHLPQTAEVNYSGAIARFSARASDFQTLDPSIAPSAEPYARLPQLLLGLRSPSASGAQYSLESEYVRFDRDLGPTGDRLHLNPALRWPLTRSYGFVAPEIGARYIGYDLDQSSGARPAVSATYAALDSGLYIDRDARFAGRDYVHTLEPRLYYLYVPFRNQDNQPVFDTALPDFTFAGLFRTNRFVGGDRIGDANQLTLALTTRIIDADDGIERLRASIGQIRYFDDRRVNIPAGTVLTERSDFAAEAVAWLRGNWHAKAAVQWNPERDETVRESYYLQYQPAADRIVTLGQRFIRDELEQLDLSTEWPLGRRWTLRARSLYSQRDNQNIETYAGVQYNACCWALRLHAAERLRPAVAGEPVPEPTREVMLELELSGFGKLGSAPQTPLAQGLFGFPLPEGARTRR